MGYWEEKINKKKYYLFFWVISIIIFLVIGSYSLTFIQNNNLDSQIFELNRFQSCKLLYIESIIVNNLSMADPVSNNCAVSSLINTKDENEKYLRDKEKIFYYMLGSILSSVALIILSIIHPFKVDKGYSNNP